MKKDEYTREEHRETRTANNRDLCGSGDRKVYKRKRDIAKGGDRWRVVEKRERERRREKNGGSKAIWNALRKYRHRFFSGQWD